MSEGYCKKKPTRSKELHCIYDQPCTNMTELSKMKVLLLTMCVRPPVKIPKNSRSRRKTNRESLLTFILNYPAHNRVGSNLRRFIAFNDWPCPEHPLRLSDGIPVVNSAYWESMQWTVTLKKIVVWECHRATERWQQRGEVVYITEDNISTPIHTLLDCGTSPSRYKVYGT